MPVPPGDGDEFADEYEDLVARVDEQPSEVPQDPEPQPEERIDGYAPFDITASRITKPADRPPLVDDAGERLPEFDERYRDDFEGLAFIGSLSKEFEWMGHKFVIRTLTVDELLAVTSLTKEFDQTLGTALAYRTAMAAMATVTIDGQELPVPFESDSDNYAWAFQRFNHVKARWFQFTVDAVYGQYLELEERTRQVVAAMGKASGPMALMTG
jgi:hypothetical protein